MATEKRIYSSEHAMLGHTGAPSDTLAPGDYVVLDEDLESHKAILRDIEAGNADHLSVREVDLDQERENDEARKRLQSELDTLDTIPGSASMPNQAAEEHRDTLDKARANLAPEAADADAEDVGEFNPEEHGVGDVIKHLQNSSPEEVDRVKQLEANSSRNSTRVASYQPSSED